MHAYLIKSEKTITRQEGDCPAPIVMIVPDVVDMLNYNVKFEVHNSSMRRIISKSTEAGTVTVDGQTITIPLTEADTKGRPGKHKWEIQFYNNTPEIITAGRGPFVVTNENIK